MDSLPFTFAPNMPEGATDAFLQQTLGFGPADYLPPPEAPTAEPTGLMGGYQPPVQDWRDRLALALSGLSDVQVPTTRYRGQPSGFGPALLLGMAKGFRAIGAQRISERERMNQALQQYAHERNVSALQTQREMAHEAERSKNQQRLEILKGSMRTTTPGRATVPASSLGLPWLKSVGNLPLTGSEAISALKPTPAQAGIGQFDPVAVHEAMVRGDIPTDPAGYTRGQWGMVASAAAKVGDKGFKDRQLDYLGTKTFWGTRNRQQQLSISQNLERVGPSLDLVRGLSDQFYKVAPGFGIKAFNSASVTAAANGAYGAAAKNLAGQLIQQINDVRFELQQVYGNGYSPTDQALKLASEAMSKAWDHNSLGGLIDNAKRNVEIRRVSLQNVGPATPSNPTGEVASPVTPSFLPTQPSALPFLPAPQEVPVLMRSADGKVMIKANAAAADSLERSGDFVRVSPVRAHTRAVR